MNNWEKFNTFNFDHYDASNQKDCEQLSEDLNKIGFYADSICGNAVNNNNVKFLRDQLKDINSSDKYFKVFNGTSIGNLAVSLIILDDLELKQRILTVLKDYQKWRCNSMLNGKFDL